MAGSSPFTNVPAGSSFRLLNLGPDEPFGGFPTPASDPDTTGQVMEFRVVAASGPDPSTPPRFLQVPAIRGSAASWRCPSAPWMSTSSVLRPSLPRPGHGPAPRRRQVGTGFEPGPAARSAVAAPPTVVVENREVRRELLGDHGICHGVDPATAHEDHRRSRAERAPPRLSR
jgi:hypothetical protein